MSSVNTVSGIAAPFANFITSQASPAEIAKSILADTQIGQSGHHIDQIAARLESFAQNDPIKEVNVLAEIIKGLSPAEQGELARVSKMSGSQTDCADRSYVPAGKMKDIIIKMTDSHFHPANYYTVSSHATLDGLHGVPNTSPSASPDEQAKAFIADIKAHGWDGRKPIMLIACEMGKSKVTPIIARLTGVPVIAATNIVTGTVGILSATQKVMTEDGRPNGGRFWQFNPDGTKQNPMGISENYAVVGFEHAMKNGKLVLTPLTVPKSAIVQ